MRSSRRFLAAAALCALAAALSHAQTPLGTAFTYQGELADNGAVATGTYDLRFRLYDAAAGGAQIGSTLCSDNLTVAGGRFAASLDFGQAAFSGQKRYLEIEVRQDTGLDCSNAAGFTLLTPRQELTATPNATFAQTAATATTAANASSLNGQSANFYQNAANLTGTISDSRLSGNVARLDANQTFTGLLNFANAGNTFAGNGAGLTNLNGGSINAGTLARSSLSADVQSGVGTLVPSLSLAGSAGTGISPFCVAVSGSLAYVVNRDSNTLQVFNISSPAAITLAGSVATGSLPFSIAVSGSFAYVVNQDSQTLQAFNISNPAAITLAGSVATGSLPYSIAVSGSFAYVVNRSSGTLQVFNISNPAAPTLAGSVATGASPSSVVVSGAFAYVVNFSSSTLQVFDIGNPAAITLAGSVATTGQPTSVAASGSFAYVTNNNSNTLQVFNISNPAAITLAGSVAVAGPPNCLAVSGSLAYVGSNSNTLQLFNIGDPAAIKQISIVPAINRPIFVAVSGSFAYVVNFPSNTLQVFKTLGVDFGASLAGSSLNGVNGSGLNSVNATQLNGQPASFYTNAANITTGTLANRITTGTDLSLPSTLVLRDASGNFAAGAITATLNGNALSATNATTATTATTATNATQLNGQAASFYTNAANITTGTRANAQTTGTDLGTPSTLVLRDASGNFSAGTITAALNGNATSATTATTATTATNATNATTATTATTATNATLLNGQPATFYANASNITSGALADGLLSGNIPRLNVNNTFTGSEQAFAGRIRVNTGIIQKGGATITATNDLGLYVAAPGEFIRFTTNGGGFVWYSDGAVNPGGGAARMQLTGAGNLSVVGSLSKGGGSFKIDHPLDPENKYLCHSFVESPDMMNVYNGNITTGADGYATITLPDYFEALNREFGIS